MEVPLSRVCFVTVSISPLDGGDATTRELGEFHATWSKGVTIGSGERCDVRLPGLAPIAAVVLAASNHKVLYRPGSPGFALACKYDGESFPDYDERIDYSPFEVGPYRLQFGERYAGD